MLCVLVTVQTAMELCITDAARDTLKSFGFGFKRHGDKPDDKAG